MPIPSKSPALAVLLTSLAAMSDGALSDLKGGVGTLTNCNLVGEGTYAENTMGCCRQEDQPFSFDFYDFLDDCHIDDDCCDHGTCNVNRKCQWVTTTSGGGGGGLPIVSNVTHCLLDGLGEYGDSPTDVSKCCREEDAPFGFDGSELECMFDTECCGDGTCNASNECEWPATGGAEGDPHILTWGREWFDVRIPYAVSVLTLFASIAYSSRKHCSTSSTAVHGCVRLDLGRRPRFCRKSWVVGPYPHQSALFIQLHRIGCPKDWRGRYPGSGVLWSVLCQRSR